MKTNSGALILPATPGKGTNSAASLDIRDVKAPVPIPTFWLWAAWIGGALAVAAVSYWWWKRFQRSRLISKSPIVIPPHRRARERLSHALSLFNQPVPFCVLVSDTIRQYLEERFELHAPERTTEEFLTELQTSHVLTQKQKDSLAQFLTQCDLVKFARHEPAQPELQALYDAALSLIEETEYVAPAVASSVSREA